MPAPTVETLLAEAVERTDPADRAAFLDRACGGDSAVRAEVGRLADLHFRAGDFLEPPPADETEAYALDPVADAAVGTRVGPFTLRELLGAGGMGAVYVADQAEPVRRRVALKLIRPGMGSGEVVARFEQERQALALMDHPGIARVLDGGTASDGRPYFAMELVRGLPITDYCDRARLATRARLALFADVCRAVQHAHQKGVIHRDLKPSNILVTLYDGRPVPKVIDFGIAKAVGATLAAEPVYTQFAQLVGTPLYMSPEQAELSALDIDTRSDVYSLGVLLYQLLTGTTPFDAEALRAAGFDGMRRLIREQEPPRPSERLSTLAAAARSTVSDRRGVDGRRLSRQLRGELDWVVMKALEKDRTRRYESASAFAADVQRYLDDEAVEACPPSALYRLRKFARRNKGQVVAAGLVLATLLAGVVGTTGGMVRAEGHRIEAELARAAEAERAEGEREAKQEALAAAAAERQAREQAQRRLAQIETGNEIITSIFTDLDIRAVKAGGEPLEAVLAKRLVKAAGQLVGEAVGDPLVVAGLQSRLGLSLVSLGYPQDAIPLFVKARETQSARLGADHPATLASMNHLAAGYYATGRRDLAIPLYEEAVKFRKAKLGVDHPDTLASMNELATLYRVSNNWVLAAPLFEETRRHRQAKLGVDHLDTLISMIELGQDYVGTGQPDLALPIFDEAMKLSKAKLGDDHPQMLTIMYWLACGYRDAGKLDSALQIFEETLKISKAKRGAEHPQTLMIMNGLAMTYRAAGKVDLALPLHQEVFAAIEKREFQYKYAGWFVSELIDCHEQLLQFDQAEAWRRKWLAGAKARYGADSVYYAGELAVRGVMLLRKKRWAAAEPLLREAVAIQENKDDSWIRFSTLSMLGAALLGQKKYADAEPILRKGYEGMKQREKTVQPHGFFISPQDALDWLIELSVATNKPDEVTKWRAERAKYPAEMAPPPRPKGGP